MPNLPALITLIVYAIVLFGIGLWAAQRAKSQEDFLLGARNLGPWVAGLAYAASSSSAWVLLGFSGFVYAAGPSALWMVPGIIAGYAVVWLWAGPVLQSASRDGGQLTLTEFMSEFATGLSARLIRILASILIAICFSFLMGFVVCKTFVNMVALINNSGAFWLYAGINLVGGIILYFTLPETGDKST